jgi:folate-binding protein YgfZ
MSKAYQALRENAAWIDLSARGKIRLSGEDRARLLHAMCTQNIADMKPGEGAYAFFLNAQGRILSDANIFCFEDHFLLDTEPEMARSLFEHIDRYIIADDVTLTDETAQTATISIEGPQAERVLRDLGAAIPDGDHRTAMWDGVIVAQVSSTGAPGYFLFVSLVSNAAAKDGLVAKLGAVPEANAAEARVARIENGLPRFGEEITDRYLVQETAQMRAVHLSKGCYLGQEIVERVRSRGQVHRLLRKLELDTAEPPAAGTKLTAGGADAAEIASSAISPATGKAVALAYVRAPFAEPGTVIEMGIDGNTFTARVS